MCIIQKGFSSAELYQVHVHELTLSQLCHLKLDHSSLLETLGPTSGDATPYQSGWHSHSMSSSLSQFSAFVSRYFYSMSTSLSQFSAFVSRYFYSMSTLLSQFSAFVSRYFYSMSTLLSQFSVFVSRYLCSISTLLSQFSVFVSRYLLLTRA